jgi:hypothetical protein
MKNPYLFCGAICAASAALVTAAHAANPMFAGTYVTNPSQVSSATVDATNPSTTAGDVISMQIANDATNVYVYLTYNSSVSFYSTNLAIDSDNNPTTGYAVFSSTNIGSNLGINGGYGFTETAYDPTTGKGYNTDQSYYGTGYGTVTPATFANSQTATTLLYTIPLLTTLQTDPAALDTGGYTGPDFPTSSFTIEAYDSQTDTLGPIEYTLAAVPEPASLSLLALGAVPLLRRRRA